MNNFPERSALIALSGGVDSAVLLAKAKAAGITLHASTVISEFTPAREVTAAEALAKRFAVPWHPIRISILADADIRQNPPERWVNTSASRWRKDTMSLSARTSGPRSSPFRFPPTLPALRMPCAR